MKLGIIDDEWICSFLAQKLIQKVVPDSEISHFKNGLEAIDFMKQNRLSPLSLPEFILLDINMPVANGWDFLDMLNDLEISNYHPVIYISSSSQDPEDIAMAKKYASVKGFLPKPLTPFKLAGVLDNIGE
ncbi:response regulator [Dyadobacter subterraneus]|uniref:Response regulator n=1 Tax=Dyadobacter subterraneus TaxID=2773304 RepID=A0ABR9WBB5_9BACT|nr:response regulator [Dyadobacter subterraneus]MBE9461524.1 response regulator [Dyadobacter subterraneus]